MSYRKMMKRTNGHRHDREYANMRRIELCINFMDVVRNTLQNRN